ncbi:SDR family NAD(P)-dependent oxidoreductase [Actinomyces sp. MRS3W]|uniref:SDR family NAD(P)-dependent oxidoreductase n=1 Tax=Actinomyces sp. MRS3W TaxID=2800796 RepID=UPI0028FD33C3|nr:SDR family NAD(P)-dependent oxidoreductase [Actinomyces sp. MRS3W]MDU0349436.1 SDR family NAD(P)-dependent oxidoreductase [Actinomyces sp. MRS3W]
MARVLVTGTSTGLGLGALHDLIEAGAQVVAHVRRAEQLETVARSLGTEVPGVVGELADQAQVRGVAEQVAALGGVDAIIHSAGTMDERLVLPVNVVAPYLLTALVPAKRHVYLSSGMHRGGRLTASQLAGLNWTVGGSLVSYSDSKLLVTALAAAVGRLRPGTWANAVDPGWVPTRMGGAGAPDDLEAGHRTQAWLALGKDPRTHTSAYWHHMHTQQPDRRTGDVNFQDQLLAALERATGTRLE